MTAGTDIVNKASEQLGLPYSWGSEDPATGGLDCSGLVRWAYRQFGITTPRTTWDMVGSGSTLVPIQQSELQPGDLVFSHWTDPTPNSHVAIYAGNNTVIEAGDPVQISPLGPGYMSHVDQFRRVPGLDGSPGSGTGTVVGGVLAGIAGMGGPIGGIAKWIPNPGNLVDAVENVGTGLLGVASGVGQVGSLATVVSKALLPSNLLRGLFLVMGFVSILIGIWFLSLEVREK